MSGDKGESGRPAGGRSGSGGDARLQAAWREAIGLLMDDLVRRDAAERTRRAYGVDLEQFAQWAAAQGLSPRQVG
ncbi:MAG: integrase/recombinase XerC, partial [Solirubrobacteraceae bacterium]|nr:integrase/recombinase XerC [Solirubrobacteraceae bacterium]